MKRTWPLTLKSFRSCPLPVGSSSGSHWSPGAAPWSSLTCPAPVLQAKGNPHPFIETHPSLGPNMLFFWWACSFAFPLPGGFYLSFRSQLNFLEDHLFPPSFCLGIDFGEYLRQEILWWLSGEKKFPVTQEVQVWSLGQEDPLEKGIESHFSILARKIQWTGKPGRLQSMGCKESDKLKRLCMHAQGGVLPASVLSDYLVVEWIDMLYFSLPSRHHSSKENFYVLICLMLIFSLNYDCMGSEIMSVLPSTVSCTQ